MELDTKESDLENLQTKLAHVNLDTASLSSGTGNETCTDMTGEGVANMEGWLQVRLLANVLMLTHNLLSNICINLKFIIPDSFKAEHPPSRLEEAVRDRL
jgi:hypothetical protein